MTPGGRPRGGGHNRLTWIDSSICIYSMVLLSVCMQSFCIVHCSVCLEERAAFRFRKLFMPYIEYRKRQQLLFHSPSTTRNKKGLTVLGQRPQSPPACCTCPWKLHPHIFSFERLTQECMRGDSIGRKDCSKPYRPFIWEVGLKRGSNRVSLELSNLFNCSACHAAEASTIISWKHN
jgi:hypothetical protein